MESLGEIQLQRIERINVCRIMVEIEHNKMYELHHMKTVLTLMLGSGVFFDPGEK